MIIILLISSICSVVGIQQTEWLYVRDLENNETVPFRIAIKYDRDNVERMTVMANFISHPKARNYPYLTTEQIQDEFITERVRIRSNRVINYLNNSDVNLEHCVNYGDSIKCNTYVHLVNKIFNINMKEYHHPIHKRTMYRASTNYVIPIEIKKYISFIEGLSHLPMMGTKRLYKSFDPTNVADSGFMMREVHERMYNMTINNSMFNTSIGVVEFSGNGFKQSNMDMTMMLNGDTEQDVVCVIGYNPKESGIEDELDMQMVGIISNGVNICYINYNDNLWVYDMFADLAINPKTPNVVSISYGWAEWDQCDIVECNNETAKQYIERTNLESMKLVLRGISVFVSSGDAGSPTRVNEDCVYKTVTGQPYPTVSADYPGCAPWITSVGGTFVRSQPSQEFNYTSKACLTNQCINGTTTQTISYDTVGWTTGGGFAIYTTETRPTWQDYVVKQYLKENITFPNSSYWNRHGRGYPDVTDNAHNCPVWGISDRSNDPKYYDVDGTSCSSPLFAAKVALINSYLQSVGKRTLGFMNPLLYLVSQEYPNVFKQPDFITNTHCTEYRCCNDDFGYNAPNDNIPWNPVSGLGQMNFGLLLDYVKKID